MNEIIRFEDVEKRILTIRGQQVLIDRDVADLYGVETKRINEAVKNNPKKFPDGYLLILCEEDKMEVVENFDHLSVLKYSHAPPTAFTEKGLYMLEVTGDEISIELDLPIVKLKRIVKREKRK